MKQFFLLISFIVGTAFSQVTIDVNGKALGANANVNTNTVDPKNALEALKNQNVQTKENENPVAAIAKFIINNWQDLTQIITEGDVEGTDLRLKLNDEIDVGLAVSENSDFVNIKAKFFDVVDYTILQGKNKGTQYADDCPPECKESKAGSNKCCTAIEIRKQGVDGSFFQF